jgi:C-terminal processing protease CtpA/Prc
VAPVVDRQIQRGAACDAVDVALQMLSDKTPLLARPSDGAAEPEGDAEAQHVRLIDNYDSSARYPTRDQRLLGLFVFWNVIHYFYPYHALLDRPWDDQLVHFIPRFETAINALEYERAVHELSALIDDSHVWVRGDDAFQRSIGFGYLPLDVRRIEALPVVTALGEAARLASIAVGDVVLDVDGEPFETRSSRFARYAAASTEWARTSNDDATALRCQQGANVLVRVRDAKDVVHEASLPCGARVHQRRTTSVVTTIAPQVGYVDLDRLDVEDVDAMFDALRNTRAAIFDMRGYPHRTAWTIAARLNNRAAAIGALFRRVIVGVDAERFGARIERGADIPVSDKQKYVGVTAMLIDETTISQAEHTGLLLEAANGTKFIGSPSAGANGDITNFAIPGGMHVTFTGAEVVHADGRQLQRVGLTPDILVRPTVASVRAGKDIVLERAVEYLRAHL